MIAEPELPYIDTIEQATAMGKAMHIVRHFDPLWVPKVFGNHAHGKYTINEELRSIWDDFMSPTERVALITAYVEERMKR